MKGTEIGITQAKLAGFVRFGRLQQRERPQRIRIPTRRIQRFGNFEMVEVQKGRHEIVKNRSPRRIPANKVYL